MQCKPTGFHKVPQHPFLVFLVGVFGFPKYPRWDPKNLKILTVLNFESFLVILEAKKKQQQTQSGCAGNVPLGPEPWGRKNSSLKGASIVFRACPTARACKTQGPHGPTWDPADDGRGVLGVREPSGGRYMTYWNPLEGPGAR